MSEEFRSRVVDFVSGFYEREGRAPYISEILRRLKTNRAKLYGHFSGRLSEICQLSGVPEPEDSVRRVTLIIHDGCNG